MKTTGEFCLYKLTEHNCVCYIVWDRICIFDCSWIDFPLPLFTPGREFNQRVYSAVPTFVLFAKGLKEKC